MKNIQWSGNSQPKAEAFTQIYAPDKHMLSFIIFQPIISSSINLFNGLISDAVDSSVDAVQAGNSIDKPSENAFSFKSEESGGGGHLPTEEGFIPIVMPCEEAMSSYHAVRQVEKFPCVGGCMKSANFCACYSQQGSVLRLIRPHV